MDCEKIELDFKRCIEVCYGNFLKEWLSQSPRELVANAEKIAAAQWLREALPQAAEIEDMQFLLRYMNPLRVVRDYWLSIDAPTIGSVRDDMFHTLAVLRENESGHTKYALLEEYNPETASAPEPGVTMC